MHYEPPILTPFGSVADLTGMVGDNSGGDALYINGDSPSDAVAATDLFQAKEQSCFYNRVSNTFSFQSVTGGASREGCDALLNEWKGAEEGDILSNGAEVLQGYTPY